MVAYHLWSQSIPKILLKSSMVNSVRSTLVTLLRIITGKSLYIPSALMLSSLAKTRMWAWRLRPLGHPDLYTVPYLSHIHKLVCIQLSLLLFINTHSRHNNLPCTNLHANGHTYRPLHHLGLEEEFGFPPTAASPNLMPAFLLVFAHTQEES